MVDDNVGTPSRPSWHEREIALGLLRLANARAHLATLEQQRSDAPVAVAFDPAPLAEAERLQTDVDRATAKASGRFGGGSARGRLERSRGELDLLLERLGADSIADLRARASEPAAPAVDPTVLDFARRECAEAEKAFLEVAAMVMPDVDPADGTDAGDRADGEVVPAAASFGDDEGDLDLRIEPSAAS